MPEDCSARYDLPIRRANLCPRLGSGLAWLRMGTYAAAPGEAVLRLSVVSSLLPRLPRSSRPAFRAVLAGLLIALVTAAGGVGDGRDASVAVAGAADRSAP